MRIWMMTICLMRRSRLATQSNECAGEISRFGIDPCGRNVDKHEVRLRIAILRQSKIAPKGSAIRLRVIAGDFENNRYGCLGRLRLNGREWRAVS